MSADRERTYEWLQREGYGGMGVESGAGKGRG